MRFSLLLLILMIQGTPLFAQPLGPVYPIVEKDMLQAIQERLNAMQKSGKLEALKKEAIARSKASIHRPKPVEGVKQATRTRTWFIDPTYVAGRDVVTPDGRTVARAGDRVNPLDYVALTRHMVFFDGDNPDQRSFAARSGQHYKGRVKYVLVGGSPIALSREWKQQIYFDQGGSLVRKFGIHAVPAIVSQEGKRLRVDEIELENR